jgi:hypothetical protein
LSELSYDDWAEALAAFFFNEAQAGEEVLFAVDDRSLSEVSGLPEPEAVESLSRAVRSRVGRGWVVGNIARGVRTWRRQGATGAHPALPLLGLTVLAASQMGEERTLAAHNYYVPLRHLLDPTDDEKGPPGTFTDHIEWLWRDASRWANDDQAGHKGRLVIRDGGYFRYVGLAIQHALVKSADLRHLDAFFRRIGLEPGESIAPPELRRALAVWTVGRGEPWARRLARMSTEEELADHCEALLEREARRWDGRPRDPRTGRPVGRIRIGIASVRRPMVALYLQWDERLPETATVSLPTGGEMELARWEGWYKPYPLPDIDVGDALTEGVDIRADRFRFGLRPDDVHALAYDDDLGAWVSVDSMSYGDRYHLLVRWESSGAVIGFLKEASSGDWHVDDHASRFLPEGWQLIANVQINARPSIRPPATLGTLIPAGAGPRLRLFGGLPISPVHGVYLRGGEPTLALSTVSDDDRISIERLETGQVERFRVLDTDKREISLWRLRLEPGRYEIRHGESTVTLQIVDGMAEVAGPGAGTVVQRGLNGAEVSGTCVSPLPSVPAPRTVRAPRPGEEALILGATSEDYEVVALPAWLSTHLGFEPTWKNIDAWPAFEAAWQLLANHAGNFEAILLSDREPHPAPGADTTQWGRMITRSALAANQSERASQLWERYQAGARGERT